MTDSLEVTLQEINRHNLQDAGKCDSAFAINSKLILDARNNVINFTIASTPPYQKKYPFEPVDYGSYVDHPDRTIYFAYVNQSIAGEVRLRRNWNRFAYLEDIVVDANFRRRGIGRLLIQRAVQWAKDNQLPGVMLETQDNNVAACLLYQACGFELGGFDRRLYQGLDPDSEEVALYWYLVFKSEQ